MNSLEAARPYTYEFFETPPVIGYERVLDDRYLIGHKIGRGGQASVYAANHMDTGEPLAAKFHTVPNLGAWARVQREIDAISSLSGMTYDVVQYADDGVNDEISDKPVIYSITERMWGGSLYDKIRNSKHGRVEAPALLDATIPAFRALGICHELGLVHRDVKPSNILMDVDGNGKLSDFGVVCAEDTAAPELLAKQHISPEVMLGELTMKNFVVGTLQFIPPEVLEQHEYTSAVDVYDAGITLHYGLNGVNPVSNAQELGSHIDLVERFDPSLIPLHAGFVERQIGRLAKVCMEKEPENRPTIHEVVTRLEEIKEGTRPQGDKPIGIFIGNRGIGPVEMDDSNDAELQSVTVAV